MEVSEGREALRNAALAMIAVGVVLAGLVYGRTFLIPLAISILVWNLLEAVIERFTSVRLGSFQVPRWLAALLGIVVVVLGLYLIQSILLGQVDAVDRGVAAIYGAIADDCWRPHPVAGRRNSRRSSKQAFGEIDLTERLPGAFRLRSVLRRKLLAHPCLCRLPLRGKRLHDGRRSSRCFPTRRARTRRARS